MGKVTWRTGRDVLHFASPGDAAKYRIDTASVSVSDDIQMLLSRIEALEKRLSRPRSGAHGPSGIAPTNSPDMSSVEHESCSWSDTSCILEIPDVPEKDLTGGDTTACDTDECSNGIDTMHKLKLPRSQKQKQKQK